MENNTELVRLEQFVDNLLAKHKKLKALYHTLVDKLEEKNAECEKLMDTIAELRSERSEVGSRVAGLLERIEQWEVEQEKEDEAEHGELEGMQGKLFKKESVKAK